VNLPPQRAHNPLVLSSGVGEGENLYNPSSAGLAISTLYSDLYRGQSRDSPSDDVENATMFDFVDTLEERNFSEDGDLGDKSNLDELTFDGSGFRVDQGNLGGPLHNSLEDLGSSTLSVNPLERNDIPGFSHDQVVSFPRHHHSMSMPQAGVSGHVEGKKSAWYTQASHTNSQAEWRSSGGGPSSPDPLVFASALNELPPPPSQMHGYISGMPNPPYLPQNQPSHQNSAPHAPGHGGTMPPPPQALHPGHPGHPRCVFGWAFLSASYFVVIYRHYNHSYSPLPPLHPCPAESTTWFLPTCTRSTRNICPSNALLHQLLPNKPARTRPSLRWTRSLLPSSIISTRQPHIRGFSRIAPTFLPRANPRSSRSRHRR